MKLHNQLALYNQKMKKMTKTYNELIFDSFERDRQKKGGEKYVKLERAQKKLWCGPSQLPVYKR